VEKPSSEDVVAHLASSQSVLKAQMEGLAEDIKQLKSVIASANVSLTLAQEIEEPVKIRNFGAIRTGAILKRRVLPPPS
jgi:hypothetical protein